MKIPTPSTKNLNRALVATLFALSTVGIYLLTQPIYFQSKENLSKPSSLERPKKQLYDIKKEATKENSYAISESLPSASNLETKNIERKITFSISSNNQKKYIASIQADKTIILHEIFVDGKYKRLSLKDNKKFTEEINPNEEIGAIAISGDGKYLAASFNTENVTKAFQGIKNRIVIWETKNSEVVAKLYGPSDLDNDNQKSNKAYNYFTYSLIFTPDNKFLVSGYRKEQNSQVITWKLGSILSRILEEESGKEVLLKDLEKQVDYYQLNPVDKGALQSIALSPDGKLLATSGSENIKLWDATTWDMTPIHKILNPKNSKKGAQRIAFSRDSNKLAAGIAEIDKGTTYGKVYLWNIKDSESLNNIKPQEFTHVFNSSVVSIDFSEKNNFLLAGSLDGQLKIWDLTNIEKPIEKQSASKLESAFFLLDGSQSFLTTTSDGNISTWSLAQTKEPTPSNPPQDPNPAPSKIDTSLLICGILLLLYSLFVLYLVALHRKRLTELILRSNNNLTQKEIQIIITSFENVKRELQDEIENIIHNLQEPKHKDICLDYQDGLTKKSLNIEIEIEHDSPEIVDRLKGLPKLFLPDNILQASSNQLDKSINKKDSASATFLDRLFLICLMISHLALLLMGIWLLFIGFQGILGKSVLSSSDNPQQKEMYDSKQLTK